MPYKNKPRAIIEVPRALKNYLERGKEHNETWGDYLKALLDFYRDTHRKQLKN